MKTFTFLVISIFIFSCERVNKHPRKETSNTCFPTVVIETKNDSIPIGGIFEAKVYLSDTSYFYLTDYETGKKQQVFPVFRINGELKESPDGYFYRYSETVTDQQVYEEFPNIREVSFGIIMPHPDTLGGDIEFGYRYNYVATEPNQDAR